MKRHYAYAWVLCVFLTGCASLGLVPAKSLSDKLAYGYGTYTAVLNAATTSLSMGDISVQDAEEVQKIGDQARTLLDGAKALLDAGDIAGAENKVVLATAILTQLQTYLRSKRQ